MVVEEEHEVMSVASESIGCWIWLWSDHGVTWYGYGVERQWIHDEVTGVDWVPDHVWCAHDGGQKHCQEDGDDHHDGIGENVRLGDGCRLRQVNGDETGHDSEEGSCETCPRERAIVCVRTGE